VGFVNGIPLVFIELKASHRRLENAFQDNLRDYKNTIPQLFWYNAFIILSNGSGSRIGSITSEWEHFSEWKRINEEGEMGIVSLETMIRGTCDPGKLLDLTENFILFHEVAGGTNKILAKNHQYLGVNNAIHAVQNIQQNQGRLGVFWHTQGSGKSFSMIFFSQKVQRKLPGNYTFVIVTIVMIWTTRSTRTSPTPGRSLSRKRRSRHPAPSTSKGSFRRITDISSH
jgi:type I restriction enzyme R subunit